MIWGVRGGPPSWDHDSEARDERGACGRRVRDQCARSGRAVPAAGDHGLGAGPEGRGAFGSWASPGAPEPVLVGRAAGVRAAGVHEPTGSLASADLAGAVGVSALPAE